MKSESTSLESGPVLAKPQLTTSPKLSIVGRTYSTYVPSISLTASLEEPSEVDKERKKEPLSQHSFSASYQSAIGEHIAAGASLSPRESCSSFRRLSRNHLSTNWTKNTSGRVQMNSASFDSTSSPVSIISGAPRASLGSSLLLLPTGSATSRRSFITSVSYHCGSFYQHNVAAANSLEWGSPKVRWFFYQMLHK